MPSLRSRFGSGARKLSRWSPHALACLRSVVWLSIRQNVQLFFWTQPIVLEFVLGMGLALLVRRGFALPAPVRYGLVTFGAAMLLRDFLNSGSQPRIWLTPNDFLRVSGWGIPAAMIVAGCVLKKTEALSDNWFVRIGKLLGDGSYALYLCHPIVMSAFAAAWFAARLDTKMPAYMGAGISVLLALVTSVFVHRWFELPLTRVLQGRSRTPEEKPLAVPRPVSQQA